MKEYTLEEMYNEGDFKKGNSIKADQAMLTLWNYLRSVHFTAAGFKTVWQEFLKILSDEFPNISIFNLASLKTPLQARRLYPEILIVARFVAKLKPESAENQCILGHAYRNLENLKSAAECYENAYDLAMQLITKRQLKPQDPLHLDACDYLCYLARVENNLTRQESALVHITQALAIAKKAGEKGNLKYELIYNILRRIFLDMDMLELAGEYRFRAEKFKNK